MQGMHLGSGRLTWNLFSKHRPSRGAMTPSSKTTCNHLLVSRHRRLKASDANSPSPQIQPFFKENQNICENSQEVGDFQPGCPGQGFGPAWCALQRRLLDNGFTVGREAQQTAAERFVEPALTKV